MAIKRIAGDASTYDYGFLGNFHRATRFTPEFPTAVCTRIDYLSSGSGSIKPGIYVGAVWESSALLIAQNNPVASSEGLNSTPIPPTTFVSSNTYWAGGVSDSIGVMTAKVLASEVTYSKPGVPFSLFTAPVTPGSGYSLGAVAMAFELWGYTPPVLTAVNAANPILHGATAVQVTGTDFIDLAGNPVIWLCSTGNFATAPIKVSQEVTGALDTAATININAEGLTPGTVYAFAVSALGQVSAPLEVTLSAPPEPPVVQPWLWMPDGLVNNAGCIGDGLWL